MGRPGFGTMTRGRWPRPRDLADGALFVLVAVVIVALAVGRLVPWVTGGTTLAIGGRSMEPALPIGAAALVVPVPAADLAVGDIVTVRTGPDRALVTHRIVRIAQLPGGRHLELRGDANPAPDPVLVPASDAVGRVAAVIPVAGWLLATLAMPSGLLLVVGLALMLVALAVLLEPSGGSRRMTPRRPLSAGEVSRT